MTSPTERPAWKRATTEKDGLVVPHREVQLTGDEPPVPIYDTSGPAPLPGGGLPRLRAPWLERRISFGE